MATHDDDPRTRAEISDENYRLAWKHGSISGMNLCPLPFVRITDWFKRTSFEVKGEGMRLRESRN